MRAVLHVLSSFSKATFIHLAVPHALPEHSLSTEPFHCNENIASICRGRHGCPMVKGITFPAFHFLVFSGMAKLTHQLSPGVEQTGQEVMSWKGTMHFIMDCYGLRWCYKNLPVCFALDMLLAETVLQNRGPDGGCLQRHRNLAEQAEDSYILPLRVDPLCLFCLRVCACGPLVSDRQLPISCPTWLQQCYLHV